VLLLLLLFLYGVCWEGIVLLFSSQLIYIYKGCIHLHPTQQDNDDRGFSSLVNDSLRDLI